MRTHFSKFLALALLIGIAQTLAACCVYEPWPHRGYYHEGWHDHDGWRR